MMSKKYTLIFSLFFLLLSVKIFAKGRYEDLPAYILIDLDAKKDNKVKLQKRIYKEIMPASLTKIMTAYIVFEAIDNGVISIDQKVSRAKYSKLKNIDGLFSRSNEIDIRHLISHLLVRSSNEAAFILANEIIEDEKKFVQAMNRKAKVFKMYNTYFFDSAGLDERNRTTLLDMVILIKRLNDRFKNFEEFFRMPFYGKYGDIYENRSGIFEMRSDLIGFKTGHLDKCGYHLAAWVDFNKSLYLGIIIGAKTQDERDFAMNDLLSEIQNF